MGTDETTPETSENYVYESAFSKMIPSAKSGSTNSIDAYKHLYEKDIGQKAIKQVKYFNGFPIFLQNKFLFFQYLLGPTHMLPPARFMCHSLLKSLVIQKDNIELS